MTVNKPRSIGQLLQTGDISSLSAEAATRRELAARVRSALPAEEAEHVVSAHVDETGRLVVGVDSPAWAARVRYSRTKLLEKELKVRVTIPGAAG
jgi:hypothetical protein